MPQVHRPLMSLSSCSDNITYSFIANCQTAVVHKNKTKRRSKIYKRDDGRLFQALGPAHESERSPNLRRVRSRS